ncbi:hypothetical protein FWH30_00400 [Microgenomates group bacterium]|nr:hypothetical protein [Microgenomates group bacterium]
MPSVFQSVKQAVVIGKLHGGGGLLVRKIRERPLTEAGMVASEVFMTKNIPALTENQLWGRVDRIVIFLEANENDERLLRIAKVLMDWQKKVTVVGGCWSEKWVLTAQNEAKRKKILWQKMRLGMNMAQAAMIWGWDVWGLDEKADEEMMRYLQPESKVMDRDEWLGEVAEKIWRGVDSVREEMKPKKARRIEVDEHSAMATFATEPLIKGVKVPEREMTISRLAMPRVRTQGAVRARQKIDKQKLGETRKRIDDYSQKITELTQIAEKAALSPPLSRKMKAKEKKRRNFLLVGSFLVAGGILVAAGLWWNYTVVREKFLSQMERVYLDCWIGKNDCGGERGRVADLERKQQEFEQQTVLYDLLIDEEDRAKYKNLFEQSRLLARWQNEENKNKALQWQNYGRLLGMPVSVVGEDKRAILRQQTLILQGIKTLVWEINERGWWGEDLGGGLRRK